MKSRFGGLRHGTLSFVVASGRADPDSAFDRDVRRLALIASRSTGVPSWKQAGRRSRRPLWANAAGRACLTPGGVFCYFYFCRAMADLRLAKFWLGQHRDRDDIVYDAADPDCL